MPNNDGYKIKSQIDARVEASFGTPHTSVSIRAGRHNIGPVVEIAVGVGLGASTVSMPLANARKLLEILPKTIALYEAEKQMWIRAPGPATPSEDEA